MAKGRLARVVVVVLLVVCQFGLIVWFGNVGYEGSPYPGTDELAEDYDAYVGRQVVVYGQVVETDPVTIETEVDDDSLVRYRLTGLDSDVEEGSYVGALVTPRPDGRLTVRRSVVRGERDHWYTYAVSLAAGLWVLVRVVRDWRFDVEALAFVSAGGDDRA